MQGYVFISLGSACDSAMQLNSLGLRMNSLPFDWLWNYYSGLDFVSKSFENAFEDLMSAENYEIVRHYRFGDKIPVYKNDNKVVHFHSNPFHVTADHETLKKRFESLLKIINSDCFKYFVYYRRHSEDVFGGLAVKLEDSFELTLREGIHFVNTFLQRYPKNKGQFHIFLIVQVEPTFLELAQEILGKYESKINLLGKSQYVSFDINIERNINSKYELKVWKNRFKKMISKSKHVGIGVKLRMYLNPLNIFKLKTQLFVIRLVRKTLKKLFFINL